jgi:hypothetical protein
MAARGYANVLDVEVEYGRALTADQLYAADLWLEPAEQRIDHELGQVWLTGGVVSERHWLHGPWLTLRGTAATGVTAVRAYTALNGTATTLTATTDYWLEGTTLHLPAWTGYQRVEVDYTPPSTVPAAIRWATAALVAFALGQASDSVLAEARANGVRRLQLGFGELLVDLGSTADQPPLPPRVVQLLAPYRAPVVVA